MQEPNSDIADSSARTSEASKARDAELPLYVIASLKHTNKYHEHITFWGPAWRGYVLALTNDRIGKYPEIEVRASVLNDGESCIAVPEHSIKELLSPTPYYAGSDGVARPFYDIPGPVIDNTRANWNRLIAASLPRTGRAKPKPEVFKGARRSFGVVEVQTPSGTSRIELNGSQS